MLSPLGFAFWGLTFISSVTAITSAALHAHYATKLSGVMSQHTKSLATLAQEEAHLKDLMDNSIDYFIKGAQDDIATSEAMIGYQLDDIAQFTTKSNVTKWLSIGATVLTAIFAGISIYLTVSQMLEYYSFKYTAIPRYMVDEADITETVNGVEKVINNQTAYYKVVSCNRKEGSSDVEKDNYRVLGTANDLNGDVGKQWLALYSVKYKYGRPILADSLMVQKGSDSLPKGYETGIHRFGEGAAFNLTSEYYCYNDKPDGTYVYFKNDTETVGTMTTTGNSILDMANTSGSMFSTGSLVIGVGLGLLLGAGIAALIFLPIMKKKKKVVEEE